VNAWRFLAALLAGAALGAGLFAASSAREGVIWKVRVLRVNQQPYQPVGFRILVDAPVGHMIIVGFKVWDARGQGVYSPSATDYTQSYQATALTLSWRKRGYDGNVVPHAGYFVEAFASDSTSHGKNVASPAVFYRLTT
jgi:hypothetical protein